MYTQALSQAHYLRRTHTKTRSNNTHSDKIDAAAPVADGGSGGVAAAPPAPEGELRAKT